MEDIKEQLLGIVEWLNENYNQESEDYNILFGVKPGVVKYNDHSVISFWACGAIVCIYSMLYFIQEDDGNWFINGAPNILNIGWAKSFSDAIKLLEKYVEENGKPVYFSGTNTICNYTL